MQEDQNQEDDENQYPAGDIENLVNETAEDVLKDAIWDEKEVPHWINKICEDVTEKLVRMQRPYKFIVTCLMQQKVLQSVCHSSYSCLYENATDGVQVVLYPPPSRKETSTKTVGCLITVFSTRF